MILVVYLGHGIFFSIRYVLVAVLFFSKSVLGGGLELPKLRGSIRKKGVHLYRSAHVTQGCYRIVAS